MQANHKRRKTIDAPLKKTDKVAIVGFTDSRLLAPFGHPDWEIWGINELYRYHDARQFSRWFEVHNRKLIEEDPGMPPNWPPHIQALKQFPIPVYMQEKYDDIPPSIEFPKAAIEEVLPEGRYQTSSISWLIALAIAEGFDTIGVYGVDMAQETEYMQQRPACEYWIGVARGLGIEVILPDTSDLLKSVGQYGFGDGSLFRRKLTERKEWLEQEAKRHEQILGQHDAKAKAERERIISSLQQIHGALQDVIYWRRSWSIAGDGSPTKPFTDRQPDKQVTVKAINQPDWVPEATPEEAVQEAKVPDG